MTIRVLVVDDHPVVQCGVRHVLKDDPDLDMVGATGLLATAVAMLTASPVEVVLLEVRLRDAGVVTAVRRIREASPSVKIVLFTGEPTHPLVPAAHRAGALTALPKATPPAELRAAIRAACDGTFAIEDGSQGDLLTPRQRDVLEFVATGMTNAEIAQELGLRATTVKAYWQEAMQRLGVRNRAEAIDSAYRLGLF